jgi:hypothetical protein
MICATAHIHRVVYQLHMVYEPDVEVRRGCGVVWDVIHFPNTLLIFMILWVYVCHISRGAYELDGDCEHESVPCNKQSWPILRFQKYSAYQTQLNIFNYCTTASRWF